MGFSDDIKLERECKEHGIARGRVFQTKSLYAGGGEFTISEAGKLIEHRYRFEDDPQKKKNRFGWSPGRRIHVGDTVIEYHGDILLYCSEGDRLVELVARFTHGCLEWIRPLDDYPEANRILLMEQAAR